MLYLVTRPFKWRTVFEVDHKLVGELWKGQSGKDVS